MAKRKPFVPPRKIHRIEVETGPYAGIYVRIGSVPVGEFMSLAALADGFDLETLKRADPSDRTAATLKMFDRLERLFAEFGRALIEWNIELPADDSIWDGDDPPLVPVPTTAAGLGSLDIDLAMFLIGEWLGAVGGTSDFLGAMPRPEGDSNDADSPERSLADLSRPLSAVPS